VANTGAAIPEEHRAHLFDRFYRAASGEDVKGHGLGLNIARGLARAQDGELELVRSDGEWTEFVLRLPAVESVVLG
jgi:signal transduction histidine kinase